MNTKPLIELPLLAAIWGASFLFMKVGVPEFGAFFYMALRTSIALIFLFFILAIKKQVHTLTQDKWHLFVVGTLNTAIPFVLFGWATLTLTASTTSVLNSTVPMFGALVAVVWLKDSLLKSQVLGLLIGFIGVYVLMMDKLHYQQATFLLPTLAVLGATLCYGIGANYSKRYLSHLKPLTLATGSQLSATITLLPIGLCFLPAQVPSQEAILSVLVIGLLCTGFAYLLFFRLINSLGPTNAVSVTYLIPAFGILWGNIFLDEVITMTMLAGCVLIAIGVALTTGMFKRLARKKVKPEIIV